MKREPLLDELESPRLELRVLYGPQAGSRLVVIAGRYLLGNSDDCTIILNGPRIEAEHAVIDFDDELPSITPQGGAVCDAQGNTVHDRFPMRLGMPVEIGGVWITIDYEDSPWPDPSSVAPISAGSPLTLPEVEPEPLPDDKNSEPKSHKLRAKDSNKGARKALIASAIALLTLFVGGLSVASWLINKEAAIEVAPLASADSQPTEPSYVRDLRKKLGNIVGNDSIKVSVNNKGEVVVAGYVSTTAIKARIGNLMSSYTPVPIVSVFAEDEMLAEVNKLLNKNTDNSRARLLVDDISGAKLTLTGAVATTAVRDEIIELIRNGVAGITQVDARVVTSEYLPQKLEEQIANAGLQRRLQVIARQPEFILRGKLTENEFRNWEKTLVSFVDTYGSLLPIRANIGLIETKPPVNVEAIVGGATPFIITKSGQRIERGGNINGNVLTIVRDNEIIFDGNERFKIGR